VAAARKIPGRKSSAHGGVKHKDVKRRPVNVTQPPKQPAPSPNPSIPSPSNHLLVGIGASAGGLEAMEDFMDDRIRAVELIAS